MLIKFPNIFNKGVMIAEPLNNDNELKKPPAPSTSITNKLRHCEIKISKNLILKGYFHCWSNVNRFGINKMIGIVELDDGKIIETNPHYIRFTDRNNNE